MKLVFKRFGAFIIDCSILFIVSMLINAFIPVYGDVDELSNRLFDLTDSYMNEEISVKEFNEETQSLNYVISKAAYLTTIVIYILYFVVFQAYNNGQTLGKKLLKIKVIKKDGGSLDINSLIRRCLIPYGILLNIILSIMLLTISKSHYMSISTVLSNVHMCLLVLSFILICKNGRGIQDYLAGTTVVEV